MPHLIIEYSANLDPEIKIDGLVDAVHNAAFRTGEFELAAIRTRAVARTAFKIADGNAKYGFINIIARIRPGRSADTKQKIGQAILSDASRFLTDLFAARPLALNVEIHEVNPEMTFRRNTITAGDKAKASTGHV